MSWTAERTEICAKLWREGASASIIADRLGGITRNAVIGKVHRMGLMAKRTIKQGERTDLAGRGASKGDVNGGAVKASMAAKREDAKRAARRSRERKPPMRRPQSIVSQGFPCPPPSIWAPLLKILDGACKWPIGDTWGAEMLCCAAQALPGKPYCEHHTARAWGGAAKAATKPRRRGEKP